MKNPIALLTLAFVAYAPFASLALAEEPQGTFTESSAFVKEAEAFSKDLDESSRRHFTMIIANHNLTQVVETVAGDVEKAVKSCGENNPDMKASVDGIFKGWQDAIAPSMKEAEDNISNMITAQDYAKPKEIKALLKKMDNERKAKEKGIDKTPVASKEACEHLQKTLGKTQDQLVKLLNSTLISLPQAVQGEADQKKRDEAEAKKAADEAAKAAPKDADEVKAPAPEDAPAAEETAPQ